MRKLAIIHFAPLELYPPIQNLLLVLEKEQFTHVTVYTTQAIVNLPTFTSANIRIVRLGSSGTSLGTIKRYLTYLYFYLGTLLSLMINRPDRVLYFETISSLPAIVYKRFVKKTARLFVHYHEYTSPAEFNTGMVLVRYFHQMEYKIYPLAEWVSHTNTYRMDHFIKDISPVQIQCNYILPNFPPASWLIDRERNTREPFKIVYAGALSMDTMYIREFALWVNSMRGAVSWDIYSYNYSKEVVRFLESMKSAWIKLLPGVAYAELASVYNEYDIGVILYKGHIPNYVYNAPNKLFEYLSSGLDVWFPDVMKGSFPYITQHVYPKVLSIDFNSLSGFDFNDSIDIRGYSMQKNNYTCEEALLPLLNKLRA